MSIVYVPVAEHTVEIRRRDGHTMRYLFANPADAEDLMRTSVTDPNVVMAIVTPPLNPTERTTP